MQPPHAQTAFEAARQHYINGALADVLPALGNALHDAPLNARWLDFLEQIIIDTPQIADTVPIEGELSATTAAVRAYIDAKTGELNRGINLLAQTIHAMPDPRFVLWLPRWIDETNAAHVDADTLNMLLSVTMQKYPQDQITDPDEVEAMAKLAEPVQLVRRAHADDARFEGLCFSFFYKTRQTDEMLAIVEETLAKGVLMREAFYGGVYYLAWLLSTDPTNERARAQLDALIAQSEDPTMLVDPDKLDVPNAALLAYIQASTGQLEAAANLMAQVVQHVPVQRYLPWIADWVSGLEQPSMETHQRVFNLLLMTIPRLPADEHLNTHEQAAVRRLIPLLEQFRAVQADAMTQTLLSRAYRQVGRVAEALNIAQQAYEHKPSKVTAVFVAGAYRAMGAIPQAVTYFKKALDFAPDEVAVLVDVGDMLCEHGELEEGIRYYARALEHEPNHPWAGPQAIYYRYFLHNGDGTYVDELRAYVKKHPDNDLAHSLLRHLDTLQAPYFRYLPSPSEATINVVRQMLRDTDDPAGVGLRFHVTHPEAPSTYLAIARALETVGIEDPKVEVDVETVPSPDPRAPLGDVPFVLWRFEGFKATPTFPEPDKNLRKVIARLAARPYNLNEWAVLAQQAATMEGSIARDHLLAMMTHPPKLPATIAAWDWVLRVQIGCALTIAFLDDGWHGSVRRETLVALLNGPMDWSVTAAILALTYLAERDAEIAEDVLPLLEARHASIPDSGYTPYHAPLLHSLLRLPNLPAAKRAQLEHELQQLESAA